MFRKDLTNAIVSRLTYSNVWWYKKGEYILTWKNYNWNLKAQTIADWIDLNMFWKIYEFHTEIDADIKESDKLIIDWENYDVKGIANFNWYTFSRKMIILNKVENGT